MQIPANSGAYSICTVVEKLHTGKSLSGTLLRRRGAPIFLSRLGLFQKLSSGGELFFSDPSTPRTHMESEPPPRPPGHVSALINLPHYGSNTP